MSNSSHKEDNSIRKYLVKLIKRLFPEIYQEGYRAGYDRAMTSGVKIRNALWTLVKVEGKK